MHLKTSLHRGLEFEVTKAWVALESCVGDRHVRPYVSSVSLKMMSKVSSNHPHCSLSCFTEVHIQRTVNEDYSTLSAKASILIGLLN